MPLIASSLLIPGCSFESCLQTQTVESKKKLSPVVSSFYCWQLSPSNQEAGKLVNIPCMYWGKIQDQPGVDLRNRHHCLVQWLLEERGILSCNLPGKVLLCAGKEVP